MTETVSPAATLNKAFNRDKGQAAHPLDPFRPNAAFMGISVLAVLLTLGGYALALWAHPMSLAEKGFWATILPFGLFGAISLAKTLRDKTEGVPVSRFYLILSGVAVGLAVVLGGIGLFNADWPVMDKSFFGIMSLLSLYSVIVIQKNVRDGELVKARIAEG